MQGSLAADELTKRRAKLEEWKTRLGHCGRMQKLGLATANEGRAGEAEEWRHTVRQEELLEASTAGLNSQV